ncbi:NAD(P)-dependent oxidoreductase [Limnohabitans sp. TS-CS-82]|uniref:NAD-dependent epimerase/dehydratase family protein n=1 Tax=Limnohabitans sp. TS-CS-82 TaxID=2094193 RepID=UPI001374C15F|nr:NAD-dependent epimerase/dehydratase family protein [Limnohabitans sp. TS-CS-82]
MKKIFLTGGTGFVGKHVLTALQARGFSVIAATRSDISHLPKNLVHSTTEWVSYHDAENVIRSFKPEAVIHLATEYGISATLHDVFLSNCAWPLNLLEKSISAGTKLFLNTDSFFGKREFNYPHMRPYTLSKSNFLDWGKLAVTGTQTRFITLRLEHVFGENDTPYKFVPTVIRQLKANADFDATIGTQKRDFVYVDDVVRAFMILLDSISMMALEKNEIEIGSGHSMTVRSFVELAKSISGSSSIVRFGNLPMRQKEIMDSFANTSILKILGWKPQWTVEQGLRRCIQNMDSV